MPAPCSARSRVQDASRMTPHDLARVVLEADVRGGLTRRTVLASAVLRAPRRRDVRGPHPRRRRGARLRRPGDPVAGGDRCGEPARTARPRPRDRAARFSSRTTSASSSRGRTPGTRIRADGRAQAGTGGGVNGQAEAAREITAAIDEYVSGTRSARRRGATRRPLRLQRRDARRGQAARRRPARAIRRVRRRRASAVRHARGRRGR